MTTRRHFIKATATTAGAFSLGLTGCGPEETASATDGASTAEEGRGLSILILGGTGFIGPHMVEWALARGHTVSLFNRGRTNTELFPDVETLIGDRDRKLDALEGRTWDAVIDNSGYVPRHVRDSAALLSTAVKQYLFISSISAYGNFDKASIDEDYVLGVMDDETIEQVTGDTYGPMKALCEKAVADAFPTGTTIVRPGYIVGPGDKTDRWSYWPVRVDLGGEVLAPSAPDDPVQMIDARDLARFVVGALENSILGKFNAVGPADRLTMGTMLDTIKITTGSDATFTWVGAEILEEHNVTLPIWSSPSGDSAGVHQISNARAIANGMTFTSLEETIRDTLAWWKSLDAERQAAMRSGLRVLDGPQEGFRLPPMSMEDQLIQEAKLLAAFR